VATPPSSVLTASLTLPSADAVMTVAISGSDTTAPRSRIQTKACSAPVRSLMILAYSASLLPTSQLTAAAAPEDCGICPRAESLKAYEFHVARPYDSRDALALLHSSPIIFENLPPPSSA
jgi:hypothetical protein